MNPSVYHWIEITDKFIICFAFTQIYLKLWEYYNFGTKNSRNAWHVIPAQEVNETVLVLGTWRVLNAINVTQTERIIVSGCHTENCNKARFPTEFKKTLNSFLTGKIKSYEFRGEASILRISSTSQWQIFEFSIATKYPTIRGKIITLCTARSFFFFLFFFRLRAQWQIRTTTITPPFQIHRTTRSSSQSDVCRLANGFPTEGASANRPGRVVETSLPLLPARSRILMKAGTGEWVNKRSCRRATKRD